MLAARNVKGRLTCIGGKYADGAVTATTRTTGELFVADTIPPRIRPLFTDGADLSHASGQLPRGATNLGHRLLHPAHRQQNGFPCDRLPMQGTLIHLFEEPRPAKSHSVRLTLTDACGNTACWGRNNSPVIPILFSEALLFCTRPNCKTMTDNNPDT